MTRDDIIRMAREAGIVRFEGGEMEAYGIGMADQFDHTRALWSFASPKNLARFAALVAAAEREKVARWQIGSGYTTGHGETIEDLLVELEWQVRESEREACARVCEKEMEVYCGFDKESYAGGRALTSAADAIRARGES